MPNAITAHSSGIFFSIAFLEVLLEFVYDLVKTPFVTSLKYLKVQQNKTWRSLLGGVRSF